MRKVCLDRRQGVENFALEPRTSILPSQMVYAWHIHAHASTEECEDAEKEKDESMNTGDCPDIIRPMWRPPSPCRIK